ncbi:MAG: hypothetical protein WBC44_18605 [Planctomycetaceae bacterium]
MGDPFKKVQRGDPLRIPAETFNTFIDAAKDFRSWTYPRLVGARFGLCGFGEHGWGLVAEG